MAVHKYGHFAKAAEACRVTQPTLSMQIQKLEEDLGVVLFDRSKKPILLTKMGRRIVEQAQAVIDEARKMEALVQQKDDAVTAGHLTVGLIPTIAPYLLPNLLKKLEELYPKLELKIIEMQTHQIIEALNSDEVDVGILATPLKISKIFERPLYYEPFSVLCHKGHELSRMKKLKHSALKAEDIWLLQEGHCLRHQVLDVCSIKDRATTRKYQFESGSLETLKGLVDTYGGYTLLPAMAATDLGKNCVLIPFERPLPAREVGLVFRREHYKSELIDALGDAVIKSIPDHIRKIGPSDLEVLPA